MERPPDSKQSRSRTVAVVDDDRSVNRAVSRLLKAAGLRARQFGSGDAVLALQAGHIADCFVIDVHLPDMSAFELHRRLHEAGSTAPVVIITAYDDPVHRRAAREIGAVAYLTKPFSSKSLLDAVARAVDTAAH